MANAQSRLEILISAKNSASPVLKQIASDASGLESALGNIGKGLAAGLGVATVAQLAETGYEMARAGAEASRLGTAFEGLAETAGASSDEMLAAMKEASRGTISDSELMLSANRAMLLGVADSADEMADLLEIAAARGKAMGLTTAQAFSDIVRGIGTMQKDVLDNLGILVDAESAYDNYARQIGKTGDQLSETEKRQALLNEVIRTSTDLVNANKDAGGDAADNFQRMDSSIKNAKEALGQLFSPAIVVIAQALADAATHATEAMKEQALASEESNVRIERGADLAQAAAANQQAFGDAVATTSGIFGPFVDWLGQGSEAYGRADVAARGTDLAIQETATAAQAAAAYIEQFTASNLNLVPSLAAAEAAAYAASRGIQEAGLMANLAQEQFAALRAEQEQTSNAIEQAAASAGAFIAGKMGGEAGLAKQREVTDELAAQRRLWREMGYTQEQINDVLLPGMISQMTEADRAAFKVASGTAKISDAAREAEKAFGEVESAVSGILQGALDVGVGVDPDDVLAAMGFPREDEVNENARRLADIAKNGLKNQEWLSEFQREVPDIWKMIRTAQNPQAEAAMLLRDFQDGLLTSPIDRGMVKELARRTILGDQNMASLAREIAGELALEMGIPLSQALAATSGAAGGGGGMGGEMMRVFGDSALAETQASNTGGAIVDTTIEQLRSRYSLLAQAGTEAARQWGDAFIAKVGDSVPSQLITILTDLITPQVLGRLAQQGSLTGPTP